MRNQIVEYPHPVLTEYTGDFIDSSFSIEVTNHSDNGSELVFEVLCSLKCDGMEDLINKQLASVVLRVMCFRTSFRKPYKLTLNEPTQISIPKNLVTDVIDFQAIVVINQNSADYQLEEFNKKYFGESSFKLRKGDVLANEAGIKIKLNSVLEKNAAGVVLVRGSKNTRSMTAHFASLEDENPDLTNYIYVTLPDAEFVSYGTLMKKKMYKREIERFLQASVVLPAITEGISKIRNEQMLEPDDIEKHYIGTIWADSILDALYKKTGIDDLSSSDRSDLELANILLGNVEGDSLNNLFQKIKEWSTIRQEDEVL